MGADARWALAEGFVHARVTAIIQQIGKQIGKSRRTLKALEEEGFHIEGR